MLPHFAQSPAGLALAAVAFLLPIAADGAEAIKRDFSPIFRPDAVERDVRAKAAADALRGACARSESALCYDPVDRHVVFRPARQFMPDIGGLTPETVSLRRNAIVFKYTFR